jgi:hypothetical protein
MNIVTGSKQYVAGLAVLVSRKPFYLVEYIELPIN